MFIYSYVLRVTSYYFNLKELRSYEQSTGQQKGNQKKTGKNHKREKNGQEGEKRREEDLWRVVKRFSADLPKEVGMK